MEARDLADTIRNRAGDAPVAVALILGSGLGGLAEAVEGVSIDYADLPGFPAPAVSGHAAALTIGQLGGTRVAVLGGRTHYYERGDATAMRLPLETMAALGADRMIATNAAGSLNRDMQTGAAMLIADHINFSGRNPLIGEDSDDRFVPMTHAYDPEIRSALARAATETDTSLFQGVYAWYSGPSFETPAEIRALKILGADAVGMSTVPEIILGRFLGLRCAALSAITNMAAGLSDEAIGHAHTKEMAPRGAAKIAAVLKAYLD